jgi:hypothetical protein
MQTWNDLVGGGTPNIWLTSFWGWSPGTWGCIGFTRENDRRRFAHEMPSPRLVAVYVTKSAPSPLRGKVVGLMEVGEKWGEAEEFIAPDELSRVGKEIAAGKWRFSIKAVRAWSLPDADRHRVEDLFPLSYSSNKARYIGTYGVKLQAPEIQRMKTLNFVPTAVYGS